MMSIFSSESKPHVRSQESALLDILLLLMLPFCIPALAEGSWSFPTPSLLHVSSLPPTPSLLEPTLRFAAHMEFLNGFVFLSFAYFLLRFVAYMAAEVVLYCSYLLLCVAPYMAAAVVSSSWR